MTFHTHRPSLFLCVYTPPPLAESGGGRNNGLNIPTLLPRALVCLLHSFPHSSLSLLPLLDRKKLLLLFTLEGWGGEGSECASYKPLSHSHPPPPSSPFYLVSEAAKLKEKEEKEEMHSFSPSRCLSVCELWLIFNDWFEEKKKIIKEGGPGLFPRWPLAHRLSHSHTHTRITVAESGTFTEKSLICTGAWPPTLHSPNHPLTAVHHSSVAPTHSFPS